MNRSCSAFGGTAVLDVDCAGEGAPTFRKGDVVFLVTIAPQGTTDNFRSMLCRIQDALFSFPHAQLIAAFSYLKKTFLNHFFDLSLPNFINVACLASLIQCTM